MQSLFTGLKNVGTYTATGLKKMGENIQEKYAQQTSFAESTAVEDYYKKERQERERRKRNIFIPEAPKPAAIARLIDPAKAPNAMLRVLLQSAKQSNQELPQHGINLLNCLAESPVIDIKRLRKLSFLGITDEINGLRPLIWRILLGYLPPETETWDDILRQ